MTCGTEKKMMMPQLMYLALAEQNFEDIALLL